MFVCVCVFRETCPCVLLAKENSPEIQELRRVNMEYQVRMGLVQALYSYMEHQNDDFKLKKLN